jgi:hypothetical protein
MPWDFNVSFGPFAFDAAVIPATKTICAGGGFGYGFTLDPFVPISVTAGPLPHGDNQNAKSILSGWSVSGVAQLTPWIGYHGTFNKSGSLAGPSVGTPGAAVSATVSGCTQLAQWGKPWSSWLRP